MDATLDNCPCTASSKLLRDGATTGRSKICDEKCPQRENSRLLSRGKMRDWEVSGVFINQSSGRCISSSRSVGAIGERVRQKMDCISAPRVIGLSPSTTNRVTFFSGDLSSSANRSMFFNAEMMVIDDNELEVAKTVYHCQTVGNLCTVQGPMRWLPLQY